MKNKRTNKTLNQRNIKAKSNNKAIFLDRDGTINIEKDYLYRIEDFEFIPGVIEGMKMLQDAGYLLIIITNQSGIGRGYYTKNDYKHLEKWMIKELQNYGISISGIYFCPHHPEAVVKRYRIDCSCRKPKLGMFEKAIQDFELNISECVAIGDKIRDCHICETTDCKGFLIGHNEKASVINLARQGKIRNIKYAEDLYTSAIEICNNTDYTCLTSG